MGVGHRPHGVVAVLVHVAEHPAEVLAHQPDLQRPRRVRVADRHREVRDAAEHHAAVGDAVGDVHGLAVDGEVDAAEELDVEPGRRHDHIRLQLLTRLQEDAGLGERDDPVGDHGGVAAADGPEEVSVGDGAQPLVPRVVRGVEVLVHGEARGQALLVEPSDGLARRAGELLGERPDGPLLDDVLAPGQRVAPLVPEAAPQADGELVLAGDGHHVGGGALQHGDVGGLVGHRGHQGDGGGAAADDHDLLALVVQVLGPVLRVHDLPLEALAALEVGGVALRVVVVAARGEQPARAEEALLTRLRVLHRHEPAGGLRRPFGPHHAVVVADVLLEVVLADGLAQVVQDL